MPYLSTPSWLHGGPDQALQKPGSTASGGMNAPPGSAPAAGAATPPAQQGGSGFVNLSAYLEANRPQAEAYAQKNIVNPLNQQLQGVSQQAQDYVNQRGGVQQANESGSQDYQNAQKSYLNQKAQYDRAQKAWENFASGNPGRDRGDFVNFLNDPGSWPKDMPTGTTAPWASSHNNKPFEEVIGPDVLAWRGRGNDWWNAYNGGVGPTQPQAPAQQEMPAVPQNLAGQASAANADRRAAGSMAGRAALFNRAAGSGYGYGNFDAYLSGSAPWGQVQNYPTLWNQMQPKAKGAK